MADKETRREMASFDAWRAKDAVDDLIWLARAGEDLSIDEFEAEKANQAAWRGPRLDAAQWIWVMEMDAKERALWGRAFASDTMPELLERVRKEGLCEDSPEHTAGRRLGRARALADKAILGSLDVLPEQSSASELAAEPGAKAAKTEGRAAPFARASGLAAGVATALRAMAGLAQSHAPNRPKTAALSSRLQAWRDALVSAYPDLHEAGYFCSSKEPGPWDFSASKRDLDMALDHLRERMARHGSPRALESFGLLSLLSSAQASGASAVACPASSKPAWPSAKLHSLRESMEIDEAAPQALGAPRAPRRM